MTFLAIINLHQVITARGLNFKMATSCFVRRVIYMRTGTSVDNDLHSKNMSKKLSQERCLIMCLKSDLAAIAMDSQCYVCS